MKEAYSRWKRFKFLAMGEARKANSDLLQALQKEPMTALFGDSSVLNEFN